MLENLTDRLSRVVKTMRGQARLTESNTAEMLREIRLSLLEADVALPVVKSLMEQIKFKALGEDREKIRNQGGHACEAELDQRSKEAESRDEAAGSG
jgi:signal recognition particle GTPase